MTSAENWRVTERLSGRREQAIVSEEKEAICASSECSLESEAAYISQHLLICNFVLCWFSLTYLKVEKETIQASHRILEIGHT